MIGHPPSKLLRSIFPPCFGTHKGYVFYRKEEFKSYILFNSTYGMPDEDENERREKIWTDEESNLAWAC